jgi:hypothetical protein
MPLIILLITPLSLPLVTLLVLMLKEKTKKYTMPRIIIFMETLTMTLVMITMATIITTIKAIKVVIEITALSKST